LKSYIKITVRKILILAVLLPFITALSAGDQFQILDKTFTVSENLGKGSFGDVYKVINSDGEVFAAKFVKDNPLLPLDVMAPRHKLHYDEFYKLHQSTHGIHPVLNIAVTKINSDKTKALVFLSPLRSYNLEQLLKSEQSIRLNNNDSAEQLNFKLDQILSIVDDILKGTRVIHDAGYLHKDFKPANILINSKSRAEISDWDFLIKLVAGIETKKSGISLIGTPHYIAPERILNSSPLSFHQDYYGIGGIIYDTLAKYESTARSYINKLGEEDLPPQMSVKYFRILYQNYDDYFEHLKFTLDSQKYQNNLDATALKKFQLLRELALTFLQSDDPRYESLELGYLNNAFEIKRKLIGRTRHSIPMLRKNLNLNHLATALKWTSSFPTLKLDASASKLLCGRLQKILGKQKIQETK